MSFTIGRASNQSRQFEMLARLDQLNREQARIDRQMATGLRDGPASFRIIANWLRFDKSGIMMAQDNISDGLDFIGAAETNLQAVIDILGQARDLALRGKTDTLTDDQKEKVRQDLYQLLQAADETARQARLNDTPLLDGRQIGLLTGPDGKYEDLYTIQLPRVDLDRFGLLPYAPTNPHTKPTPSGHSCPPAPKPPHGRHPAPAPKPPHGRDPVPDPKPPHGRHPAPAPRPSPHDDPALRPHCDPAPRPAHGYSKNVHGRREHQPQDGCDPVPAPKTPHHRDRPDWPRGERPSKPPQDCPPRPPHSDPTAQKPQSPFDWIKQPAPQWIKKGMPDWFQKEIPAWISPKYASQSSKTGGHEAHTSTHASKGKHTHKDKTAHVEQRVKSSAESGRPSAPSQVQGAAHSSAVAGSSFSTSHSGKGSSPHEPVSFEEIVGRIDSALKFFKQAIFSLSGDRAFLSARLSILDDQFARTESMRSRFEDADFASLQIQTARNDIYRSSALTILGRQQASQQALIAAFLGLNG